MVRERWGAFSVKDHTRKQSFTAEVLLYDRLIVPSPPQGDPAAEEEWISEGWDPHRLREVLAVLGTDLTVTVPWTEQNRGIFREHYRAVPGANAFLWTSILIARQIIQIPDARPDVTAVRFVAAYPSLSAFRRRFPLAVRTDATARDERREELGVLLAHEFLTPRGDFKEQRGLAMLKKAAGLARDEEFCESRRRIYEWQENVIDRGLSNDAALKEMREYLATYNGKIKAAMRKVRRDQAIAVFAGVGATAGLVGAGAAAIAAPAIGLPILASAVGSSVGSLVAVARLVTLERKPSFQAGESAPAAMLHTARRELGLEH